jgi:hypothetical protein
MRSMAIARPGVRDITRAAKAQKEERISIATDSGLMTRLSLLSAKLGIPISPLCETILRSRISSQIDTRELPTVSSAAFHLHQVLKEFESDGQLDPVEVRQVYDHVAEIMSLLRERTA